MGSVALHRTLALQQLCAALTKGCILQIAQRLGYEDWQSDRLITQDFVNMMIAHMIANQNSGLNIEMIISYSILANYMCLTS